MLCDKIEQLGVSAFFDITDREITCRPTGAKILFAGLFANINALKSLEKIKFCWIEEGESVYCTARPMTSSSRRPMISNNKAAFSRSPRLFTGSTM